MLNGEHKAHLESIRMKIKYKIFTTNYLKEGLGDWDTVKDPILLVCVRQQHDSTPSETEKDRYEAIR